MKGQEGEIDLSGRRTFHILGIGGTGMSALAHLLVDLGHRVGGSDSHDTPYLAALVGRGVGVRVGGDVAAAVAADVVVRSSAVRDDDPEVRAVLAAGGRVYRRSDLLAAFTRLRPTWSVSGTHGKTTTTAMAALALEGLGWAPSYLVGSLVPALGGAARWTAGGRAFCVEADESDGTHVALDTEMAVVTNVEGEHLDHHGTLGAVIDSFVDFVAAAPGAVVCADDPGALLVGRHVGGVTTYGTSVGADVVVGDVRPGSRGVMFDLVVPDGAHQVALAVPGRHNALNAGGVLAAVWRAGGSLPAAIAGIERFSGTGRRFESRGEVDGVRFVDDYAHHPTEVAATLETARSNHRGRLVAVFQPHLYSRTRRLASEFGRVLAGADVVVVTDIYGSREDPVPGVTGALVADSVRAQGATTHYLPSRSDLAEGVGDLLRPGDLCLTLGAGDITTLPDEIRRLRESGRLESGKEQG